MRTRSQTLAAIAAITLLAFPLAACGPDDDGGDPPDAGGQNDVPARRRDGPHLGHR